MCNPVHTKFEQVWKNLMHGGGGSLLSYFCSFLQVRCSVRSSSFPLRPHIYYHGDVGLNRQVVPTAVLSVYCVHTLKFAELPLCFGATGFSFQPENVLSPKQWLGWVGCINKIEAGSFSHSGILCSDLQQGKLHFFPSLSWISMTY